MQVEWRKGSAFDPSTFDALLPSCGAVVSTLGILLEGAYKTDGAVNPLQVLKGIAKGVAGDRGNPLEAGRGVGQGPTYEQMNRDAGAALSSRVCPPVDTDSSCASALSSGRRVSQLCRVDSVRDRQALAVRLHLRRGHLPPARALPLHRDKARGRANHPGRARRGGADPDSPDPPHLRPTECVADEVPPLSPALTLRCTQA